MDNRLSTRNMVRIKHRYLLINILFPEPQKDDKNIPEIIQFHRPTPDALTAQLLAQIIRENISLLYGDYGVGVTSGSLNGNYKSQTSLSVFYRFARQCNLFLEFAVFSRNM